MATTDARVTEPTATEAPPGRRPPKRAPEGRGAGHAWKRLVLGPALPTAQLEHERLGKPTALAVFASDNLSSVAYATEEILKVAVPAIGVLAFSVVMPITFGILGGARDPAVLLPPDDQGLPERRRRLHRDEGQLRAPDRAARRRGAADRLRAHGLGLGRRRGRRDHLGGAGARTPTASGCPSPSSGSSRGATCGGSASPGGLFAVPDLLLHRDDVRPPRDRDRQVARWATCTRCRSPTTSPRPRAPSACSSLLHAFASGGAAVTGVEAISNGVPAFKPARMAQRPNHPDVDGEPARSDVPRPVVSRGAAPGRSHGDQTTVISEVGRAVFGGGALGTALFLMLQVATTLILILAANTSFADFPRLANFQAKRRLHAATAHQTRTPAGVLQRDHRARGRVDRARDRCSRPTSTS